MTFSKNTPRRAPDSSRVVDDGANRKPRLATEPSAPAGEPKIGALGEFTDGQGRVCPCRILEVLDLLHVAYWNRDCGELRDGWITPDSFRPDMSHWKTNEKTDD